MKCLHKLALLAVAALLVAACSPMGRAGSDITDVTPQQAFDLILSNEGNSTFAIIDVRMPEEYAAGHIANAILLDVNSPSFKEEAARLDRAWTYLVYCRSGVRSRQAAGVMVGLGFESINNLRTGMNAWAAAGLPVAK